jgi:hypothetical protein
MMLRTALWGAIGLLTLVSAGGGPAGAQVVPRIEWRVENPFRLFTDPADTEIHRRVVMAIDGDNRRAPVVNAERMLSRNHPDGWAASMYRKTCWHWVDNRHTCPDVVDYLSPQRHRVIAVVKDVPDAPSVTCTWQLRAQGRVRQRMTSVSQACSEPAHLEVPYPSGATLSVGGVPVAQAVVEVEDLLIAGVGDSFASGEGNPDIPVRFSRERAADYTNASKGPGLAGYPARIGAWQQIGDKAFIEENARWLDQACHRSLYSHQLRAALQIALEDPHRAVTYIGLSCSGAEVTTGLFLRYKGNEWVPNPPVLSQLSALSQAQCGASRAPAVDLPEAYHMNGRIEELKGGLVLNRCPSETARKIDLLLLSIGGNDVGFSRLVANAVLADQSLLRKLGGWIGEVHGREEGMRQIQRLDERYKALNRAIHSILHIPWNESDRVILTAYPRLAVLEDGHSVCPDGRAGMEVLPDFQLSRAKVAEGTAVSNGLYLRMKASAGDHGWSFADQHRDLFLGHGICAGFAASSFSIADDLRMPRRLNGHWDPFNPADYPPYAMRQRWFRTPNDAFMTANFHVAGSVLQKALKLETLSWFQVLIASTYSGAFHPTAEGQAVIADSVVAKARAILERYSGRNREK